MRHRFKVTVILVILVFTGVPSLAEDANVTLPLDQFLKLFQQDHVSPDLKAPVPYMFSHGDYRLSQEGKWIRVEAQASLRLYETDWVEVSLLPSQVMLQKGTVNGKPLSVFVGDGRHKVLMKGAGSYQLQLVYYLPVESSSATRSLIFQAPDTSVSKFKFILPGQNLEVKASPNIPLQTRASGPRTVVIGVVPAGAGQLQLSWTPLKADPHLRGKVVKEKARLYARLYQMVIPAEKEVRSVVQVDYTILRNSVSQFRLRIPAGLEVDQIDCEQMHDWDWARDRQLLVNLEEPVSGNHSLKLHLTRPVDSIEGEWKLPAIEVLGVERIKGSVGLASDGGIEVEGRSQKEARPIDVKELPTQVSALNPTPLLLAYEYHKQPFAVEVSSRKGQELQVLEATIDEATAVTLVTNDGKICTTLNLKLRNARRQSLSLRMPADSTIWSSFVGEEPVKPMRGKDGTLRLPLKSDAGTRSMSVRLVYVQDAPVDRLLGSQSFTAPEMDIPISVMNWTVYLPEGREVFNVGGSMQVGLTALEQRVTTGEVIDGLGLGQKNEQQAEAKKRPAPKAGFFRQAYRERLDNKRMSQMIQEASQGSFPVDVQIPQTGQAFHFSSLLIDGGAPSISVRYYSNSLAWLLGLGTFALVFLAGRGRHQPSTLKKLTLGLLLVVFVHAWWPLLGRLLNGVGLATLTLLGLALYQLLRKGRTDA